MTLINSFSELDLDCMKNIKKYISIIVSLFVFVSCSSTKLENQTYINNFDDEKYMFYFVHHSPVVNININGQIFNFLIDTGCNYNLFTNRGVRKILNIVPSYDYEYFRNNTNSVISLNGGKMGELKFSIALLDNSTKYDGVLGTTFLRKKSNVVTFDYKNNEIIFSDYYMTGKKEKLISFFEENPIFFMEIKIDNRIEFFLLDTGNETIALRSNYDNEKATYPTEDILLDINFNEKKYKKTNRFKIVDLPLFVYGDIEYKDIKAVYNDYFFSKTNNSARRFLSVFSSAGFPLFNNKVFQIDFENKTVLIGE